MTELGISRIKESTFVTVSMIVLGVAGVISWIFLMAGTAAVEAEDDVFATDVGFSWWLMIFTALLYCGATLAWIFSMGKGVGLFVALSRPLALLFAVAFAWVGVELRLARVVTGDSSEEDAWFTGLFFSALTLGLYMLFFTTWTDIVGMKRGGRVRGASPQKPSAEPGAPIPEAVAPGHIPAPPGAEAIIANAQAPPAHHNPQHVYYTPPPP